MNRHLLTTLILSLSLPAMVQAAPIQRVQNPIAGQYIVLIKPDQVRGPQDFSAAARSRPSVSQFANSRARSHGAQVERVFENAVRGFSAKMSPRQAQRLADDPAILLVEEDQVMSINATQANATWGLDRVDQASLPLDTNYTYNDTAANVHAYVIDTGIFYSHTDFGGRAVPGFDAINDGRNGNDCNGHGTHVAGTIGSGTYGIAKGVQLHAVRVLNCTGGGTTAGVIAGVDWVAANHQAPAVANMSLGGGASNALDNAVRNAIARGVTFAVAAGNANANACNSSPARVTQAITVGASADTDVRATFSNFGTCLDLFAPGVNITSTWNTSNSAVNTISGTSMSSPHTAGVAALYLAANPAKTPAEVEAALKGNAVGRVTSAGTGSTNLLLQSLFAGAGTGTGATVPLNNGDTVANITDTLGNDRLYTVTVPSGATNLSVSSSGGTGNADIYLRLGSAPQLATFDCSSIATGNTENCTVATPTAGVYYIMLHATADYASLSLNVNYTTNTANQAPVANFTTAITNLNVQFTDTSNDTDGSITGWLWNFGDGGSSVLQNPSRTYAVSGSYTVTLIATDNSGASNTRSAIVTVSSGQASQPCTSCESYTGTLSAGQTVYQPNGGSYSTNVSGVHEAWLEGAAGTNFNLTLYRQFRHNRWTAVATSSGSTSSEHVSYSGTPGTYRWGLNSASGSGTYDFWMIRP